MLLSYLSEIRNRFFKNAFIITISILYFNSFFLFNILNNSLFGCVFISACIQIVEILNMTMFGKSNRQGVHRMMAVVVTFGPVFNNFFKLPILVFLLFYKTSSFIFW